MSQTGAVKLVDGDAFPPMVWDLADGGTMAVPDDLAGHWSALLLYRGHW